jgi:hypothetical protein
MNILLNRSFQHHNFGFTINPPPPPGTKVTLNISPTPLFLSGLNIPVELSTASAFRTIPSPPPLSSIVVMAHFDTGASITSIDIDLAKHLNLIPQGKSWSTTASGPLLAPVFAVDLSFPSTSLSPFKNLRIGSCKLSNFNLTNAISNPNVPQNFGILLGRDIMSRWNIVWNGPTSTVFISD